MTLPLLLCPVCGTLLIHDTMDDIQVVKCLGCAPDAVFTVSWDTKIPDDGHERKTMSEMNSEIEARIVEYNA